MTPIDQSPPQTPNPIWDEFIAKPAAFFERIKNHPDQTHFWSMWSAQRGHPSIQAHHKNEILLFALARPPYPEDQDEQNVAMILDFVRMGVNLSYKNGAMVKALLWNPSPKRLRTLWPHLPDPLPSQWTIPKEIFQTVFARYEPRGLAPDLEKTRSERLTDMVHFVMPLISFSAFSESSRSGCHPYFAFRSPPKAVPALAMIDNLLRRYPGLAHTTQKSPAYFSLLGFLEDGVFEALARPTPWDASPSQQKWVDETLQEWLKMVPSVCLFRGVHGKIKSINTRYSTADETDKKSVRVVLEKITPHLNFEQWQALNKTVRSREKSLCFLDQVELGLALAQRQDITAHLDDEISAPSTRAPKNKKM